MRRAFCGAMAPMVRMLCSRSASLTRMTRRSRDIASNILRKDSACDSSFGRELQLVQLGQAIDQVGGGRLKALDQFGLGDAAVLDHIVHQRGHDGLGIQLPLGADARDGDRVGDVGLATGARLAQVGLVRKAVGLADALDLGLVR